MFQNPHLPAQVLQGQRSGGRGCRAKASEPETHRCPAGAKAWLGWARSNVLTYEAQVPQAASWAWQVLSSEYC